MIGTIITVIGWGTVVYLLNKVLIKLKVIEDINKNGIPDQIEEIVDRVKNSVKTKVDELKKDN